MSLTITSDLRLHLNTFFLSFFLLLITKICVECSALFAFPIALRASWVRQLGCKYSSMLMLSWIHTFLDCLWFSTASFVRVCWQSDPFSFSVQSRWISLLIGVIPRARCQMKYSFLCFFVCFVFCCQLSYVANCFAFELYVVY